MGDHGSYSDCACKRGNTAPPRSEKLVPRSGEGRRRRAGPKRQNAPRQGQRGVCIEEARGIDEIADAVPV
jgi:hypothetical protein